MNKKVLCFMVSMFLCVETTVGAQSQLTGWGAYTSAGLSGMDMISNWVVLKSPQYAYFGFSSRTGADFISFKNNRFKTLAEAQYLGTRMQDEIAINLGFQVKTGKVDNYLGLTAGYKVLEMRRTRAYGTVFGPAKYPAKAFTFGLVNTYYIPLSMKEVSPFIQNKIDIDLNARINFEFAMGVRFNVSAMQKEA